MTIDSMTNLQLASLAKNEAYDDKLFFEADLLNSLGQAVIAINFAGKIIYWNQAAEELVGWSREEMLCENMQRFFIDVFLTAEPETVSRIWSKESRAREMTVKRRDGKFLEVILLKTIIFDGVGKALGVVGVLIDISNLRWIQQLTKDASKVALCTPRLL